MKNQRQITGKIGEDEVCKYLERQGHTIVARNWRSSHLELDIITYESGAFHIVEVKSRVEPVAADPLVNFTWNKQRRIVKAAAAFLHSETAAAYRRMAPELVFDLACVFIGPETVKIDYYPQAFIPTYV